MAFTCSSQKHRVDHDVCLFATRCNISQGNPQTWDLSHPFSRHLLSLSKVSRKRESQCSGNSPYTRTQVLSSQYSLHGHATFTSVGAIKRQSIRHFHLRPTDRETSRQREGEREIEIRFICSAIFFAGASSERFGRWRDCFKTRAAGTIARTTPVSPTYIQSGAA